MGDAWGVLAEEGEVIVFLCRESMRQQIRI